MHLPPVVCSLQKDGSPGDVVAILPVESLHSAALRELQRHPPEMEQNVTLQILHCPCGEYHIQIVLIKPGIEGDILVPGSFGDPKIFVQFDGSAHHDHQIGGAGAGLFEISSHGLQLLDWGCLALPSCKDNIVAEVMGADLALRLYERYINLCYHHHVSPKLLDRIQGDIKPLVNHLQFQGRFRRPDLTSIIDRFHQKRSRIAPLSAAEYRPREANFVADYLAGQGSAYLLLLRQEQTQLPLEPVCLDVAPPYELLLKNHAVIAGFHAGGKLVLTLLEMPSCAIEDIVRIMPLVEPRTQKQLSQIVLATQKLTKPMASSVDGQGRVYARQVGAQQLPRDVRALVYGRTHKEVDMTGAHYEILRRVSQSTSLPCVTPLRDRLRQVWSHAGVEQLEEEIKRFPIRVLNAGVQSTLQRARTIGLAIPPDIEAIAYELEAVRDTVTSMVMMQYRLHQPCTGSNKHFFALEYLESQFMVAFLREVKKRDRCVSLIWLHDGLWVHKDLSNTLLFSCEQIAAQEVFPTLPEWSSLLRVQEVSEPGVFSCRDVHSRSTGYLFPPPPYPVAPRFTSQHPKPRLARKRVGGGLASTFHSRMLKRCRR